MNEGQGISPNKYAILVEYKEIEIDRAIDNEEFKRINSAKCEQENTAAGKKECEEDS